MRNKGLDYELAQYKYVSVLFDPYIIFGSRGAAGVRFRSVTYFPRQKNAFFALPKLELVMEAFDNIR